jgi:hypothetical protein
MTTPGGYALLYRRENGNLVVDAVELDQTGQAKRVLRQPAILTARSRLPSDVCLRRQLVANAVRGLTAPEPFAEGDRLACRLSHHQPRRSRQSDRRRLRRDMDGETTCHVASVPGRRTGNFRARSPGSLTTVVARGTGRVDQKNRFGHLQTAFSGT